MKAAEKPACRRWRSLVSAGSPTRKIQPAMCLESSSQIRTRNNQTTTSATYNHTEGEEIMSTNTIRLHRVLRAAPDKIYRAFLDPEAMAKWLPPNGFTGKVHHMDAKVGG